MAYGIKYICDFNRLTTLDYPDYTFQILQKNYEGDAQRLTGGASVVIHRWETDNPIAPIKGSSLEVTLINEGAFPLLSIYSTDDEEFKAKLIWHADVDILMFEGFVVQDDCSELMVDYNHEVTISANDNLGLLKDVALNKAAAGYGLLYTSIEPYEITQVAATSDLLVSLGYGSTVMVGDKISIDGGEQYEIAGIEKGGTVYNLYLVENVASVAPTTGELALYRNALDNLLTLLMIIKRCISATGLELNTHIFSNINESTVTENTVCFLEQTLIDPQTFLKGENNYDDCYTVLEKILQRFNFTLFQAKGVWNMVRWHEARVYDYDVPGHAYDAEFNLLPDKVYLDGRLVVDEGVTFQGFPKFLIGSGEHTAAETGLLQRIQRPYEHVKETFNYKQPTELLRNANFTQLGPLIQTYTTGSGDDLQLIAEYEAKWWNYTDETPTGSGVNGAAVFFIRVILDSLGNEVERYMVVKNNDIHSYRIEANKGDKVKFSFSFKTPDGFTTIIVYIKLTDGTNTVFANEPGSTPTWATTVGYNATVTAVANEWTSVETETASIPFDGILTVYLRAYSTSGNGENQYKDVRLEYIPTINQSTKIIGHTHTSEHPITIKNNDEKEIFVDNTSRNSLAGTLFLNELDGILQKRCNQWKMFSGAAMNLGELTTRENLFLRRTPRMILEGTFYNLISEIVDTPTIHDHVSLLTVVKHNYVPYINFCFGRLEIDYRNNKCSGTLFEMYKDNEQDSELTNLYTFDFIYDSK